MKRHELLLDTLYRLETGRYTGPDIYWCGQTIDWLWRFRKITEDEKNSLCDRVIAICKSEMNG